MNYWIIKSEPNTYSYERLEKDGSTTWDGVRNYAARNNLREMKKDDICCFYHSNEGKHIVGLAKVTKEHYQDPTTPDRCFFGQSGPPSQPTKIGFTHLSIMRRFPALSTNCSNVRPAISIIASMWIAHWNNGMRKIRRPPFR